MAAFAAAPSTVRAEVIGGVLSTQPRPAARHSTATSVLGEELGPPFRRGRGGPGGWVFHDEPELHLGEGPDILVPDLAGWRRERLAHVAADALFFDVAPDWICEVLSPSTHRHDRGHKLPVYAREGVGHVWLVDPSEQSVQVYRLTHSQYVVTAVVGGDARVRLEPFDAVELDLALLWSP
jgi:Uma2 family endonuclease